MNRRLRIGLIAAGGLVLALVLAAFIATYVVLQPDRFTAMLQSRARAAGLELTLASPASPTLWPKPALELDGMIVRANGAGAPLIVASRGKLVLPWHTLLGGDARISRLEIEGARIDVDAISDYLDTLPPRPSTSGAILPTIDAGFRVSRGTLTRGNQLLLSDVDIDAGRLANGRPFTLAFAAHTADTTPYSLDLETTPTLSRGVLTLGDAKINVASASRFDATLHGEATWRGAADVGASLAGRVTREAGAPYDIVLNVTPANQRDPLYIALKLDGENDHTDLRIPPLALGEWWGGIRAGGRPTLPPLLGTVEAKTLDVGGVQATGLRIRATPNVPVPAATAPAPASTAATP
ncbi:AsmA family protein [Luteibacter sp. 329MFSha]|uniref:AsmA family protein n=1 Tax=Luteibacter sp. 329MFSha TaxID=1798239 RepID=UPI0008D2E37D|nr:AsmA family protein [Luteibacter sp. 329MFSha]SEV83581.1 AsmA protein [Luteibacter sp. 329MFSha]